MDHLSVDTVPLAVLPASGPTFVVRLDERTGMVSLDEN
jgi:hypothetical protein